MKARTALIFLFLFALSACGSPFAPVVLAPENIQVIDSPATLPDSLKPLYILWSGDLVHLGRTGIISYPHSDADSFEDVSDDGKLIAQVVAPVVKGEKGLPYVEDNKLVVYDVHLQKRTILVSKNRQFPDAVLLESPTFTSDSKQVVFLVAWEYESDLARVDIQSGEVQRLNVNVTLTNFALPDVSRDGYIVVICRGPQSSELCLLDAKGKFIRYLTEERYPWPGYGRFTPDGEWVVYESRFKLYKVRIDGSERQQIAPCSTFVGVQAVTDDYAVTDCYVSQDPDCFALFVASLDGSDFRRIGYIEPYCASEK